MRFFLAPLASLLSLAVFWTAWRGNSAPDQDRIGIIFSLGLAVIGLLLGLQARKGYQGGPSEGGDDQIGGWRGEFLGRTRGPWALIAVVIGLVSLVLQLLALVTPFGARLRG